MNCLVSAACILLAIAATLFPVSGSAASDLAVYGDSLATGWDDWSWNTTVNFTNSSPVYSGTNSIAATFNAAWGAVRLNSYTAIFGTDYDTLEFWINGGSQGGQRLGVMLSDGNHNLIEPGVEIQALAGWHQIRIALTDLGNPPTIRGIAWQDRTGGAQQVFYLDQISFVGVVPPPPNGQGPGLDIDASAGRHTISEDIYGMNFADETLAMELRLPVSRWGGNNTTRYNWQNDTMNHDRDWYYENIPLDNPHPALLPDGSSADRFAEQNRRTNTRSIITVPLIGWTPKARSVACGFSVAKYGQQESTDPWRPDCGNGVRPDGTLINSDPYDTGVSVGPSFAKSWIDHLALRYGTAANGGVTYYNLDNEPMLWHTTHRDVHPQPVSYNEIRDRTYQYSSAIKAVDSTAQTLGPTAWGWCDYFYSALDGCQAGTDYQTHGNTPFVAWYLQQMRSYEELNRVRILDYLDLHYYPQAANVSLAPEGDDSTQALRLRSTRSLWDTSYMDESWIFGVVKLIPRMREWVNVNYPGTKLGMSEYNWGGLESINGALAQADVLGIFGREELDLATIWSPPAATQPGAFAFRMYRNYDGAGNGFGDISVQATSQDQDKLSVYAAERSADHALTVIVINKTGNDLTSVVGLAGLAQAPTAAVYRYSAASADAIVHTADLPIAGSGFTTTFPANSITLFVIATAGTGSHTLTITKAGTGSGSVTANAGTINWNGNTGTAIYGFNTAVTLTTSADTGSLFGGWTGCNSAAGNDCSVVMDAPKAVTATFIPAPCSFSISPISATFSKSGGKGSVSVSASTGSCQWQAMSNQSWITVTSGSVGTGNGTVKYSVSKNSSRQQRTGTITVAGKTFTIVQQK